MGGHFNCSLRFCLVKQPQQHARAGAQPDRALRAARETREAG